MKMLCKTICIDLVIPKAPNLPLIFTLMGNCFEKNPIRQSEIWRWVTMYFWSHESRKTKKRHHTWGQWQLKKSCFHQITLHDLKIMGKIGHELQGGEKVNYGDYQNSHIFQRCLTEQGHNTHQVMWNRKLTSVRTHCVCFVNRVVLIKFMVTLQDHKTSQRGLL